MLSSWFQFVLCLWKFQHFRGARWRVCKASVNYSSNFWYILRIKRNSQTDCSITVVTTPVTPTRTALQPASLEPICGRRPTGNGRTLTYLPAARIWCRSIQYMFNTSKLKVRPHFKGITSKPVRALLSLLSFCFKSQQCRITMKDLLLNEGMSRGSVISR